MRYTLVAEGPSDRALLPVINWILEDAGCKTIEPQFSDLSFLRERPRDLLDRVRASVRYYPCDLLLVHKDSDGMPRQERVEQIREGLSGLGFDPLICLVPVREQEAWFLFSEQAIRVAAGSGRGRTQLLLPRLSQIESVANPKELLRDLLLAAADLSGRRRARFDLQSAKLRLADLIDDYSPLRRVSAFAATEEAIRQALTRS